MDKWNTTPPTEDGAYLCTIEGQTMHGKFRYLNICNYENGAWDEKRVIAWMPCRVRVGESRSKTERIERWRR